MKNSLFILIVVTSIVNQQNGKYIRSLPCIIFARLDNIFFLIHFSFCSLQKEKAYSKHTFVNISHAFQDLRGCSGLPDVRLKDVFQKNK